MKKINQNTKVTILLPTYNRAHTLDKTLGYLVQLFDQETGVRVVVIDNCCTDGTKDVVARYELSLDLEYFFAGRAGKSKALNDAISSVNLDEIVVFIDDDEFPCDGWIDGIRRSAIEWPDHAVFGGRIRPLWPAGSPPQGMRRGNARQYGLGAHDIGDESRLYPGSQTPSGGNFWLRKKVLEEGHRFEETMGPMGAAVIMGEDTDFLLKLRGKGYEFVYVPDACLDHVVEAHRLEWKALCQRAYVQGRGGVQVSGICHPEMFEKKLIMWFLRRTASYFISGLKFCTAGLLPSGEVKAQMRLSALSGLGYNFESLRIGYAKFRNCQSEKCKVR